MTQRQLHHQSPPQHGRQLTKPEKLEHTAQPAGGAVDWSVCSVTLVCTPCGQLSWFHVSQAAGLSLL